MKHARGKAYGIFGALLILLAAAARSIWAAGEGAEYVAAAGSQSLYRLEVAQSRGSIYDRDLEPLVGETRELVAAVALGYPDQTPKMPKRRAGRCVFL